MAALVLDAELAGRLRDADERDEQRGSDDDRPAWASAPAVREDRDPFAEVPPAMRSLMGG